MQRFYILILILCGCILLCSCTGYTAQNEAGSQIDLTPPPSLPPIPTPHPIVEAAVIPPYQSDGIRDISAWAAYWDKQDVLGELFPYCARLEALCYFEAFFDENGAIVLPTEIDELYSSVESTYPDNRWDSYITFVNDMQKANGEFDLKSPALIAPFISDENAMDMHIDALIGFTKEKGFDGIEIDYEALRKMPELWEPFTVFLAKLYEKTQTESLKLRVVLEPNTPFDKYAFPQGPTYVIMCYNLHGAHNDAGPKADYAFLSEIMDKASILPGRKIFALATGGYDWDDSGEVSQVTLSAAYELYSKYKRERPIRYDASAALSFKYRDEENREHTVWYADTQTLKSWSDFVIEHGFDELAYWRLGGNYLK